MCIMNELVRVQYKYRQTKEAEWAKQFGGFTWLLPKPEPGCDSDQVCGSLLSERLR